MDINRDEAILFAQIAHLAYGAGRDHGPFMLIGRFSYAGTDTQGIFGKVDGSIGGTPGVDRFILAFRGSEETGVADWITDLKFVQQVFPYDQSGQSQVKVHFGFIQAYRSVRDAVLNQVRYWGMQDVVCVGHSLGGALAILAALDIQYNMPELAVSCFTYGCPKVGNWYFAQSYNRRVPKTFRFVNGGDLVPKTPPGLYVHVGQECRIGNKRVDWRDLIGNIQAHFPYNYLKALSEFFSTDDPE